MATKADEVIGQRWGFGACCGILGWVVDAYSFFVPIFLLDQLAQHFSVSKSAVVATITVTLATRPLGALLFGYLSDRGGRRYPLLLCVLYFSLITAATPFTSSFRIFVALRALYGIGMGGYWGVGAALVMESCPVRWRGLFSGILQAGYSIGYLLAALAASIMEPKLGWQSMFLAALVVAGAIVLLLLPAVEPAPSDAIDGHRQNLWIIVGVHWRSFIFLAILMTVITCLSHGTQDLYPDFLKIAHGYGSGKVSGMVILYNIGAGLGAILAGKLSDRIGRKNSIYLAIGICSLALPAWAFGVSLWTLAIGAFIMQAGVQGAFGVVPAYLNELAPPRARSLFSGLVYQLGMLLGAPCVIVEYAFSRQLGYARALATFEGCVIIVLGLVLIGAKENRNRSLAR